jgi:hypothetical protein
MNLAVVEHNCERFDDAWRTLHGRQLERDALYSAESLAFYREYRPVDEIEDLSFLIVNGAEGLIGMAMQAYRMPAGGVEISCHGLPCLFGENPRMDYSLRQSAKKLFKREMMLRLDRHRVVDRLVFRDYLDNAQISYPGRLLLAQGAKASPYLSQIVDLSLSEAELRGVLTKSVRWSINWGMKALDIRILDQGSINVPDMAAFRTLHIEAAGRETRSQLTWDLQLDLVRAGAGFVVLGSLDGQLVTAALFVTSRQHCYYGVSASKRELFDKPIAHAVIWSAMLHAKNALELKLFEMGEQRFPLLHAIAPNEKDLGISFFKRSFGGETEVSLDLTLQGPVQHSVDKSA